MTESSLNDICRRIVEIAPSLHTAGTFSARVFNAIAQRARKRDIHRSAETGSGASTLLFSHLSEQHTVFAFDAGSGSVTNVRRSPLLRPGVVTFVEGPTQATLPKYRFTEKIQLVLIDGPHAYPFPDMEYYCFYPHLDCGGLLILDDIHIRSVHNLFEFLRRDVMFELDEVVETTAFFRRAEAPTFDPLGDGWWEQSYNAKPLLRYAWKDKIRMLLPQSARRSLSRLGRRMAAAGTDNCSVHILEPRSGALVEGSGIVEGSAVLPGKSYLWILAHRRGLEGWWPQSGGPAYVDKSRWKVPVSYGGHQDIGHEFEIAALVVGQASHELWTDWVKQVKETETFPPVRIPPAKFVLAEAYRTVKKNS